jgi:uncharacterized protein (DUF58 family)
VRAIAASGPPPGGRLKLTPEGLAWFAAAAVLGLLGWSKGLHLLLILAYSMLGLLVLNGIAARRHSRRVSARRVLPPPVFAGEATETSILASVSGSKPATIVVVDRDRNFTAAELAAGTSASFARDESFPTRGRVAFPPLLAGSSFPFGFLQHDEPQSKDDVVEVLPALGTADADGLRHWLLRMAGGAGHSRKVLRRVTHEQADVRGVRPYRTGDGMRAIHWRSSARRGELMVREFDSAPSPELLLVVDPWLPSEPTDQDHANLESALSLAATIAFTWCRDLSTRVTLMVGRQVIHASESTIRQALVPLADAETLPEPSAPDLPRSVLRAARLIVSSRRNSPLAASLGREVGKPFAVLDPGQPTPWYRPPGKPEAAT